MLKSLLYNKEKLLEPVNTPLNENCSAVILKKLPKKLRDPGKFLIPYGFSELKCKALADLGASINLMPLSVWKKLGLPELISTQMTLELANREICTPVGIARDVFVPVGRFTFPADFVIVDYESDPQMILHDGDERLILNMRHDTSSYSNKPKKESINMIDIYNVSHKDYLEDLFANEKITNHQSGNPTFSSHTDLTSPEVINSLSGNPTPILEPVTKSSSSPIITSFEESELIWEEFEAYLASDSFPPGNDDPVDLLLEEFADELALITFPPGNDDLPFDIESDLREIEYLLNNDPTKEMDSILEDSVDEGNLLHPNNNLVDDEHTHDYSSPPLYDDVDDDLVELEYVNDNVYDDLFDTKEDRIKESKLLIDELHPPRSSDFLPSPECDSVFYEDFFEVDALPSTDNEDKVFNPGILIHENLFEITICVTPDKNVKKLSSSNASLILKDFNPPLYGLPFHKEVPGFKTLLSFSSENEEKVFNPGILVETKKIVRSFKLRVIKDRKWIVDGMCGSNGFGDDGFLEVSSDTVDRDMVSVIMVGLLLVGSCSDDIGYVGRSSVISVGIRAFGKCAGLDVLWAVGDEIGGRISWLTGGWGIGAVSGGLNDGMDVNVKVVVDCVNGFLGMDGICIVECMVRNMVGRRCLSEMHYCVKSDSVLYRM
ncbi:reverse transcriptase domain-containing protein [Tanacetum coccineum]